MFELEHVKRTSLCKQYSIQWTYLPILNQNDSYLNTPKKIWGRVLFMGLFRRKKNKEPVTYQVSEEQIQNLKENGVTVDIAIGYHGADEIVAGAMIGDMGKLIAMGNYGKTKYKSTTL